MPTRVLYVNHISQIGGAEAALLTLLGGIDREQFAPLALCPRATHRPHGGALPQRLTQIGVPVHLAALPRPRRDLSVPRELARRALFSPWLAARLREWRVDLVHTNSLSAQMAAAEAAQDAGLPVVWHMHSILQHRWPNGWLLRRAARSADRIACVSRAVARELDLQGVDPRKLTVIHNGLDLEAGFRPRSAIGLLHAQYGLPPSAQIVATIGQLTPGKGQDVFIRAAAVIAGDHPRAIFMMVGAPLFGDPRWRRRLQRLAQSVGLRDRIVFTGARDDIPALLAEVELVVHASVGADSLPTVLLEAGAMARPAVATMSGGASEIIADGRTGLLVAPGDVEAMASAMHRLLSNRGAARTMGQAARRLVEKRFARAQFVGRFEALYRELLHVPASGTSRAGPALEQAAQIAHDADVAPRHQPEDNG